MFDVMRSFVHQNHKKGIKEATFVQALYRSTLAGAEILGVQKLSGNLNKGKEASFLVVEFPHSKMPTTPELLIKKLIDQHKKKREDYTKLIKMVYLNGQKI
jgi:guanine deaminase